VPRLHVSDAKRAGASGIRQYHRSVTDAQGSGVAGAKVVVTNVTKGTTEETTTNESGNYTVTHLIPDSYRIRSKRRDLRPMKSRMSA